MNDKTASGSASEEVRVLYTACVAEIAGFKQQQWQVTNYALLVDAVTVTVAQLLGDKCTTDLNAFALFLLALVSTVIGCFFVQKFAASIHERRKRLTHIRQHRFSEEFRESWRAGHTCDERPDDPNEKDDLRGVFYLIQIAGLSLAAVLMLRRLCGA